MFLEKSEYFKISKSNFEAYSARILCTACLQYTYSPVEFAKMQSNDHNIKISDTDYLP